MVGEGVPLAPNVGSSIDEHNVLLLIFQPVEVRLPLSRSHVCSLVDA